MQTRTVTRLPANQVGRRTALTFARSLDADWPPRQTITITDLVAQARAADWDFTNWCYASGYDARDPDARRMFECLLELR
jgi:hypothetical protein